MFVIVYTTVGGRKEALNIAKALVQEKLVACVNFSPIESVYSWKSKLCVDREYALICKTTKKKFKDVEKRIMELHSYDLPCIIATPIPSGSKRYLDWIKKNVY